MPRFAYLLFVTLGMTASTVSAQAPKFATVFAFSTQSLDGNVTEEALLAAGGTDRLRPLANKVSVVQVYVKNPTNETASFVVQVNDGAIVSAPVADVEAGMWKRVKFAVPPAAPAPVVPSPAPGTPAPEPKPVGKELKATGGAFPLSFQLLDSERKSLKSKVPTLLKAEIALADPTSYITEKSRVASVAGDLARVNLGFGAAKDTPTSAQLRLSFPKFGNDPKLAIRNGLTQRTLSKEFPSAILSANVANSGTSLLAHVAVDGIERTFIYKVTPTESGEKQFQKIDSVAARVFPEKDSTTFLATKAKASFAVRVEVDNAKPSDQLELHIRREGASAEETEVISLGSPREERVWVEAGESASQGLALTTRSRDWVYPVSLAEARGRIEIVPVLKPGAIPAGNVSPLTLVVDETPPEVTGIRFTNLIDEKQLEKGGPLRVAATVRDLESSVTKAVFLLGKAGEDGKPAPDAVKVVGTLQPVDPKAKGKPDPFSSVWTAALPIPAEGASELTLWVSATDAAENTALSEPKRIEIVPAAAPGTKPGKIQGAVTYAERPQPGLVVQLEADGKFKAKATTDETGRFVFDKLPPGNYKLSTSKSDFSTGLAGSSEVVVESGATAKTVVALSRPKAK